MDQTVQHIASKAVENTPDFWLGFMVCAVLVILLVREALNLIKWYKGYKNSEEEIVSGNSVQRFIQLLGTVEDIQRQTEKISSLNGRLESFHNDMNVSMGSIEKTLDKHISDEDQNHQSIKKAVNSTLGYVEEIKRKMDARDSFI